MNKYFDIYFVTYFRDVLKNLAGNRLDKHECDLHLLVMNMVTMYTT